jgi:hypothetical protein
MRRRSAVDGLFQLRSGHRARIAHEIDMTPHVGAMTEPIGMYGDEAARRAYHLGLLTEQTRSQQARASRYWRFICGLAAVGIFALTSVLVYWVTEIATSVSSTLDEVLYAHPKIIDETVTDLKTMLHGAATASHSFGATAEASRPSLVNLTASSSQLLTRFADLMNRPRVAIDLSG